VSDEHGERALSFGQVAEDYEATRPGWPVEPFAQAFEHFGVRERPDVVDVAAGTGKLTRTLALLAGTLVAVEPDAELRAVIQRVLPEVEVLAGTAEELPLPTESADVVCAGQAFHWFDMVRAPAEMARVLRPGGILIAGWNTETGDGSWYDAVIEFLETSNPDHLPAKNRDWAAAFAMLPGYDGLTPFEFRHEQPTDYATFARLLGTQSAIARLAPERRAALIEEARAVAVEQGAFDRDGNAAIPWLCQFCVLRRRQSRV
jgi:SAM-dependent methyltransferase